MRVKSDHDRFVRLVVCMPRAEKKMPSPEMRISERNLRQCQAMKLPNIRTAANNRR